QRVKFAEKLKESVMEAVREETKKIEAREQESVLEAVRAEREILLKQFNQLIPNFNPNLLASCSNVRPLLLEEDNLTNDADTAEKRKDEMDLSKLDMPPALLAPCQIVKIKLKPANETIRIHILKEVFGTEHDTFLLYLFDYLKMANIVNLVGLVDPRQVNSQSRTLSYHSKHLSGCLKNANGDQFYLVPYNLGGHWVLIIVKPAMETIYYTDSLPNRSIDEDMRNIVNT
ncbi:PREDICTED: PRUPE_6G193600, partial [Prunus dulcis]